MGLARVFRRSVRFTFRSKRRFFVFLLIFAIVSTLIAFYVDGLDDLQTDSLLAQKGVTVEQRSNQDVGYSVGLDLFEDITSFADSSEDVALESAMHFSYIDVDQALRLHSIDIDNPWISNFAKPSLITDGRYPSAENEIIIPRGAFQQFDIGDGSYQLNSRLSVGQSLTLVDDNGNEQELEIVGLFDVSEYKLDNPDNQLWLFMDQDKYEELITFFDYDLEDDALSYSMSFVVEGMILMDETYEMANTLNQYVIDVLKDAQYDGFEDIPEDTLPLESTVTEATTVITTLGFVIIGGIILATLFAYLITRFRRREIAILKAMGYSHSAVRTTLLGELLTTSFSGFIFGLGLAQFLLLYQTDYDFNTLIRLRAVGVSFLVMVVIALPGMLLTSRRVLSVSPAEAFRDN